MSEDNLVQTDVSQADVPSGHLDFEAKAREIAHGWWDDDCGSTLNELIPIVASALSEAYEAGRGLVQTQAEPTTELSGHQKTEFENVVNRLREWFRDPDNGAFEAEDFHAFMIDAGLASEGGCGCFLYDTQVCDVCQGVEAQVTEPKSQGEFETKSIIDHPYYNPRTPDDER